MQGMTKQRLREIAGEFEQCETTTEKGEWAAEYGLALLVHLAMALGRLEGYDKLLASWQPRGSGENGNDGQMV